MPFNGSGTFTLPSGNPVVAGTTASPTVHNNTNTELANGLTNCITRDGQSPATANIPLGGFKMTGAGAGTVPGDLIRYEQVSSSAALAALVSDETGTGSLVLANSPTLVNPSLGTPLVLVGTNITGTAAGLTSGNATTAATATTATTATNLSNTASTKLPTITATVAASALTIGATAQYLDFRSATLGSGAISTINAAPAALVVPATATLGSTSTVLSRLIVIEMNNAGTAELAVCNASGFTYDESQLVTTTAIAAASNSSTTVYSTTARASLPFRVVGFIESTQATAGTWATAPSEINGLSVQLDGALIKFTIITATNAVWAKQTKTKRIVAQCIGGGGAGGGFNNSSSYSGAGGMAGEIVTGESSTLTDLFSATIGAGGTGNLNATGSNGATTSFITSSAVTICTAQGGLGGLCVLGSGASNGQSCIGRGGLAGNNATGGAAEANSGAAGGGVYSGASNLAGGAGGSGIIYIWEYS